MPLRRLVSLLLFIVSVNSHADALPYVVALTTGFSDDAKQSYGVSGYETRGKGLWGVYGEMLFSADEAHFLHSDGSEQWIEAKDRQFNFTVGGSYGFTDHLYGLVGVGIRSKNVSTAPANDVSVCDQDNDDEINPHNNEQYCSSTRNNRAALQLGLLYVTPMGLSIAGAIDTEKTATLSVGYQF